MSISRLEKLRPFRSGDEVLHSRDMPWAPRALRMPRAFRASAIPARDVAPEAWTARISGVEIGREPIGLADLRFSAERGGAARIGSVAVWCSGPCRRRGQPGALAHKPVLLLGERGIEGAA
jgi:hypothetical protein